MARLQAGSVPCGVCSTCGEQHGADIGGFAQNDRGAEV